MVGFLFGLVFIVFWSFVFYYLSTWPDNEPAVEDLEEIIAPLPTPHDPKLNQLIAEKYYRGITRADLERAAKRLGIPYSDQDSYVELKKKVETWGN